MSKHDDDTCPHLVRASLLESENARLKADVVELADALKLASEVGIKVADEVTRLKAEVERLTKAHSDALADFWAIHKGYFDLKAEVERLRASSFVTAVPVEQYERLREAGDALAAWTLTLEHTYDHKPMDGLPFSSFLCVWHEAAKEGKHP